MGVFLYRYAKNYTCRLRVKPNNLVKFVKPLIMGAIGIAKC